MMIALTASGFSIVARSWTPIYRKVKWQSDQHTRGLTLRASASRASRARVGVVPSGRDGLTSLHRIKRPPSRHFFRLWTFHVPRSGARISQGSGRWVGLGGLRLDSARACIEPITQGFSQRLGMRSARGQGQRRRSVALRS
ncbi:hypothetical protein OF83DRAFT_827320 [Amylostereum chailletii]|nr:hypothetical protein OF83DRAFT_827320 [Amylostereum chailletii]